VHPAEGDHRRMPTSDRSPLLGAGGPERSDAARARRRRPLARALRLARVGFCFAYFGVGVWFSGVALMPLVRAWSRLRGLSPEATQRSAQRVVHLFCRSFVASLTRAWGVARVEWIGAEALARGPALLVANHPSLIDTPLLLSKLPQADCIVSPDWLRLGWLRRVCESAGYLRAEDGADVVRGAAERLRAGRTLLVYPEGSRTPPEGPRRFQRGAAHMALEAGCPILPITISVTPRVLMRGARLADYPLENPTWRIEVGEPIQPPPGPAGESRALAARRLTGVLEEHFQKGWGRGRS
jgi:1-acyl-sn-glycerol-3-phosphate acyltransferase